MARKISKTKAALSHAIAYAIEELEGCGYRNLTIQEDKVGYFGEEILDKLREATTIKKLIESIPQNVYGRRELVSEFYKAMLKVVDHLDYPEYSGTECRGWYRVWGAITQNTDYYCNFDLGRDVGMLITFFEYGTITEEQFNTHRAKNTLRQAMNTMVNGIPDTDKILKYWRPEYREKAVDLKMLAALSMYCLNK